MALVGAGGYVGMVYYPQFVVAELITLENLFDCEEVLFFLATSTLGAFLGGGGPTSTCTVKAVKLFSIAVTLVPL